MKHSDDRPPAHGSRRDGERAARRHGGGEAATRERGRARPGASRPAREHARGPGSSVMTRLKRAAGAAGLSTLLLVAAACGGGENAGSAGEGRVGGAVESGSPAEVGQETDTADAPGPAEAGEPELTTLDVAGHEVKVEIADDEEERRRGLMHRDSLPQDQGMLFVYPEEQTLSFYMRNTEIPLDIAFLDRRGYIVDIQQMEPHSEELHRSSQPALYALEMNRGWFGAHGVEEGDRVRF